MNAADIAEQVKAIETEAKARGLIVFYVIIAVDTFSGHNVRGTISTQKNIEANGDDFADCIANLRAALANHIPDEDRLASILGYTEVKA